MDTGSVRPLAGTVPVQPAKPTERAEPAADSTAPRVATVPPSAEPPAAEDALARRASEGNVEKQYRLNPATGVYVWRAVDESSGDVLSQIPSDAYLLQKAAYRRAADAAAGRLLDTEA